MKRLLLLITVIPMFLSGCVREPVADFIASETLVNKHESIIFTNRSLDAVDYRWDFGDGYYSFNYNVSHSYDAPGIYTVSLQAQNRNGDIDICYLDIEVTTSLMITVEEYYEPYYLVPDVRVRLYPSLTDWENETNRIAEGYSNSNGRIRFDGLLPKRYYVDVYGPNHDNYKLAEEDAGFIETDVLLSGELNEFTALVDYYPPKMRSGDNTKILKNIQKSAEKTTESRKAKERLK